MALARHLPTPVIHPSSASVDNNISRVEIQTLPLTAPPSRTSADGRALTMARKHVQIVDESRRGDAEAVASRLLDGSHDEKELPVTSRLVTVPFTTLPPPPMPIASEEHVPPLAIYHICRICLRPRSHSYHLEHPIPLDGMPPPPGICRRCRVLPVEDVAVVDEVVKQGVSNEIKLGFFTPFMADGHMTSNQEAKKMEVDRVLGGMADRELYIKESTPPRREWVIRRRVSKPAITYRHVQAPQESSDTTRRICKTAVDSKKEDLEYVPTRPDWWYAANTTPTSMQVEPTEREQSQPQKEAKPAAHTSTSMQVAPTEQESRLPYHKARKGSRLQEVRIIRTRFAAQKPSPPLDVRNRTLVELQKIPSRPSRQPDIVVEVVARKDDKEHAIETQDLQKFSDGLRRVAREEVRRYRHAERKLGAHPSAYAYGRMVPIGHDIDVRRTIVRPDCRHEDEKRCTSKFAGMAHVKRNDYLRRAGCVESETKSKHRRSATHNDTGRTIKVREVFETTGPPLETQSARQSSKAGPQTTVASSERPMDVDSAIPPQLGTRFTSHAQTTDRARANQFDVTSRSRRRVAIHGSEKPFLDSHSCTQDRMHSTNNKGKDDRRDRTTQSFIPEALNHQDLTMNRDSRSSGQWQTSASGRTPLNGAAVQDPGRLESLRNPRRVYLVTSSRKTQWPTGDPPQNTATRQAADDRTCHDTRRDPITVPHDYVASAEPACRQDSTVSESPTWERRVRTVQPANRSYGREPFDDAPPTHVDIWDRVEVDQYFPQSTSHHRSGVRSKNDVPALDNGKERFEGSARVTEYSNRVTFSNQVEVSPTPPGSDASSEEFRSYHSVEREGDRKTGSRSKFEQTGFRTRTDDEGRGRSRSRAQRHQEDQHTNRQDEAADKTLRKEELRRALSESPSREESLSRAPTRFSARAAQHRPGIGWSGRKEDRGSDSMRSRDEGAQASSRRDQWW